MKGSRFSEGQVIAILREQEAGARTEEVCRRHGISSATLVEAGVSGCPIWAHLHVVTPNRCLQSITARPEPGPSCHGGAVHMVGLEGHYKSQGLSVPVRSVSPFSDPSSTCAI